MFQIPGKLAEFGANETDSYSLIMLELTEKIIVHIHNGLKSEAVSL